MCLYKFYPLVYVRFITALLFRFRYFHNRTNSFLSCTFPRILVGEAGFVGCKNFRTTYICPSNSSLSLPRLEVCNNERCTGCDTDRLLHGAGPGFKCTSNFFADCVLPQFLLYDNVPDCDNGEDLCFDGRRVESKWLQELNFVFQLKSWLTSNIIWNAKLET